MLQTDTPSHQRIPVPDHNPVRIGTLNSILRLVATHKGVNKQDVLASLTQPETGVDLYRIQQPGPRSFFAEASQ